MSICPKLDTHIHLRLPGSVREQNIGCSMEAMLPHMQSLGIRKAVLMSGGESDGRLAANAECRAMAEADPAHFAWMCNLDVQNCRTVYDRLAALRTQGAVGVGEVMAHVPMDSDFASALFAAAGKLRLPVTLHMSPAAGVSYGLIDAPRLPLLEKALQQFPDTVFVGHSQCFWIELSGDAPTDIPGRRKPGSGPVLPGGRLPELLRKYPNLYADLSANSGGQAILRDPAFGLAFLEEFSDRLFFATDMLRADMVFPLGAWLDEQAQSGALSRETYEKICYQNACRMYGLSF